MSRHLLRATMALGIAALALSFTAPARSEDQPAPKPKRHQFTGIVESVDAKAGSVIVKKDAESKTFKLVEKTKYSTTEKKEAALADIKVGDKVTVAYSEEGGVLTAHKIGVPASVAKKEREEKKE
jgi:Cu/Ag efflux protein CusF